MPPAKSMGRYLFRPSVSLLAAVGAIMLAAASAPAADAASGGATVEVILSGLPKMRIRSYQKLKQLAGATMVQRLALSRSELWSVEESRVEALTAAARRYGVRVMRADSNAPSMLMPMRSAPAMSSTQASMMTRAMQSPAAMAMTTMRMPDASMIEYALTNGMQADPANAAPATISLPLDAETAVTVRRTRVEPTKSGCIWHGVVDGSDQPVTLMWWADGRLTGTLSHNGRMYAIRHMGGDMHGVVTIDPDKLPDEHAPTPAMRKSGGDMSADPLVRYGDASMLRPDRHARAHSQRSGSAGEAADAQVPRASGVALPSTIALEGAGTISSPPPATGEGSVIDVIVAYTKAAAGHYTDIKRDLISLAIEAANQSFRNSGVGNVRLRLVHAYETAYVEKGEHFDHLWRFADRGDGVMEEIHRLRNEMRGDVALLIVNDPIGCGLATRVAADAEEAFAVIHHECAALTYTLAHEVGHIIGARHDHSLDQSTSPYPFGHGYVHAKDWRTMMSYKQSCDNCPRLPVWSSPSVKIRGVPAGSDAHNNAEVIAREAKRVAGFR